MMVFKATVPEEVRENLPYKNFEYITHGINLKIEISGKTFLEVSDFPVYDFVSAALWWTKHCKRKFQYQRQGMDDISWISFDVATCDEIHISSPYQKFDCTETVSLNDIKEALNQLEADIRPSEKWYAQFGSLS